jgi:hypothetical protein
MKNDNKKGASTMTIYEIIQEGAGTYEIEAETAEEALREMAEGIVDTTEDWKVQYYTDDREEAIQRAIRTLTVTFMKLSSIHGAGH